MPAWSANTGGSGEMSSSQIFAFLIALADLALGGLISNGFIVTVMIREWPKRKRLASSEQLLLSLGISNLCATAVLAPYFFDSFSIITVSEKLLAKILPLGVFILTSRFWFTAWLCVFYCIKLVNSTQSLFLWWKLRISWLIPRLLVRSLVIPLCICCYALQNILIALKSNTKGNVTNGTQRNPILYISVSFKFTFIYIGSACPFLVVLFCSILVIASLCRHVCRIKGNGSSFGSLQTKVHMKAAGIVLCLLFLYISFVVTYVFALTESVERKTALASVVMVMYSPAQAAILVLVNPKLKQAATQML